MGTPIWPIEGVALNSTSDLVAGSLAADIESIEQHVHNRERWFGIASPQTATDWGSLATLSPYQAISGNNAYGADADDEAQVVGTADTPAIAGMTSFDIHRILVVTRSVITAYKLRIIYGTGTMADAITAGQYSEVMTISSIAGAVAVEAAPISIIMPRVAIDTKVWIQCWNATNNATIDFVVGIHEYAVPL